MVGSFESECTAVASVASDCSCDFLKAVTEVASDILEPKALNSGTNKRGF